MKGIIEKLHRNQAHRNSNILIVGGESNSRDSLPHLDVFK